MKNSQINDRIALIDVKELHCPTIIETNTPTWGFKGQFDDKCMFVTAEKKRLTFSQREVVTLLCWKMSCVSLTL